MTSRPAVWAAPVLWTVLLGLWGIGRQRSVWRDEAATWLVAQRSTGQIAHTLQHMDAVHGLYYLWMHVLFSCFGPGILTLRLPSVLAMAGAAACVAVIGGRLGGFRTGLAAGLALPLLPAVQYQLQDGRSYALVAAGVGLSTLLLAALLQGRGGAGRWVAYGGVVLVTGLLHWLSLLVLPAHVVTLLWSRARRGTWARWAGVSAGAVAGVLPLILYSRDQAGQVAWIPPLTWHSVIGPVVLLAVGGLVALPTRPKAGRLSVAAVGLPLLAVPQLGLVGLSFIQPVFLDRYVVFSQLGLALLIGAVLDEGVRAAAPRLPRVSAWLIPLVVVVAVAGLLPQSLAVRSPASRVDDVLAVADRVRELRRDGDAVLFVPVFRRDTALVSSVAFAGLRDIALTRSPAESGTLGGEEADPATIRTLTLAERRVLLVTDAVATGGSVPVTRDSAKLTVLREHFTVVTDETVRGRRVTVYERRPATELRVT
ncbi:glycosyltransferase family 39 protein [Streptomyces seoulensis]